jgi:hypothetical protein
MAAAIATLTVGWVGSAPAEATVTYPATGPLPSVTATTLDGRYQATEQAVRQALVVAREEHDDERATTLESLIGRNLLEFDARGNGRVVEVIGDLATADRIAMVVPGSHTTMDTYDRNRGPGGGARALAEEVGAIAPGVRVATVAWLGYDTPQGLSHRAITDGLASTGVDALRTTVTTVREVNRAAPISLLCHSYGSVLCARAVADLPIADIAFYGSPGVGVATAADLATSARVWAGRAPGDWIRFIPSVRLAGLGFGTDPVDPAFGAQLFATGDGGHGDYHLRGGEALHSLALITLGIMGVSNG